MNPELDQRDYFDEQSCREFEAMLDEREADEEAYAKWLAEREEFLSERSR